MQNTINSWDDVTLDVIRRIENIQGDVIDVDVQLVSIIFDIDIDDVWKMSVPEMGKYTQRLKWIYDSPDISDLNEIIWQGCRFVPCTEASEISYAQYVDYQNYIRDVSKNRGEIIACLFKPENGEYNKGYSMKAFTEHVYQTVTLPEFRGFFLSWQMKLMNLTNSSLTWLKWLRMIQPKRMRKQMDSLIRETKTLLSGLGLSNR